MGRALPASLLPRSAARGTCRGRRARRGHRRHRERARPPRRGDAPRPIRDARRFPSARSAGVHRRRPHPRRFAPATAVHPRAVLHDPGRNGRALRRPARGARQQRGHRAALQPHRSRSAGITCPSFRHRPASPSTSIFATKRRRASSRGSRASIRTRRSASASVPSTRRGSRSKPAPSCRWGLRATSSSSPISSTGRGATACRSVRDGDRARARSLPTRSASPTSIPCATRCCSSASSIPSGCRCRTSTSTSARTAAIA